MQFQLSYSELHSIVNALDDQYTALVKQARSESSSSLIRFHRDNAFKVAQLKYKVQNILHEADRIRFDAYDEKELQDAMAHARAVHEQLTILSEEKEPKG